MDDKPWSLGLRRAPRHMLSQKCGPLLVGIAKGNERTPAIFRGTLI